MKLDKQWIWTGWLKEKNLFMKFICFVIRYFYENLRFLRTWKFKNDFDYLSISKFDDLKIFYEGGEF